MSDAIKKLVQRADKVAFMKVKDQFNRMKGFTSMNTSKNPKEYTRQYVDEIFETTDVVGISASIEYAFDQFKGDPVHDMLVEMTDNELIGTAATVEIMVVDFSKEQVGEGFPASKRTYSNIPNTEGDSLDAYTYGGTFRVNGKPVKGTASSTDDFEQIAEFKEAVTAPDGQ